MSAVLSSSSCAASSTCGYRSGNDESLTAAGPRADPAFERKAPVDELIPGCELSQTYSISIRHDDLSLSRHFALFAQYSYDGGKE